MIDIETKTNEEITAEMLSEIPDTYQKNAGYFIWDFLRAISYSIEKLWNGLRYLASFFNIENLDYDDLVKFVFQRRGIIAKTATCSKGLLTIKNGSGTISKNDIFETASGLQFRALETKEVEADGTFEAECLTRGAIGNVPVGAVTVIPVTISGITSISNDSNFSGGYDAETKESIIERYYDDLRRPITSGNKYHYKKWAKECIGVGDAKVYPLEDGDNTVKLRIIDSNFEAASSELIATVQEYIDPSSNGRGEGQAPCGAYCSVVSASALSLSIAAVVELEATITEAVASANAEAKIKKYLKSIAFQKDYVSYAQIGACILNAEGVKDYSGLTINGGTSNIDVDSTQVAVLGKCAVRIE